MTHSDSIPAFRLFHNHFVHNFVYLQRSSMIYLYRLIEAGLQSVERCLFNDVGVDLECMPIPVHRKMDECINHSSLFIKINRFRWNSVYLRCKYIFDIQTYFHLYTILPFSSCDSWSWHTVFGSFTCTIRSRPIAWKIENRKMAQLLVHKRNWAIRARMTVQRVFHFHFSVRL